MSSSSSVIIRLQNLSWEARSTDIRQFFSGLTIPDGGVHIIGGPKGDAFIAFQSDEDARQAMMKDGSHICNKRIKLMLSSKNEMYNVIAQARGVEMSKKMSNESQQTTTFSSISQDSATGSNIDSSKKDSGNASVSASVLERVRQTFPSSSNATDGTALNVAKHILSSLSALGTSVTSVSSASVLAHLQQLISQSGMSSKTTQSQPVITSSALSPPLTSIPGLDLSSFLTTHQPAVTSSSTLLSPATSSHHSLKAKQSAVVTATSTTVATSTVPSSAANINQAQLAKLIAAANQVSTTSDIVRISQPSVDTVHGTIPTQASFTPSTFPFPVFGGIPFPFPMPGVPGGPPFPSAMPFAPMVRPHQPDVAIGMQSSYEVQPSIPAVSPQITQHPLHQLPASTQNIIPQQNLLVVPPNPFASSQTVPSASTTYFAHPTMPMPQTEHHTMQIDPTQNVETAVSEPYLRISGLHKFEAYKQIKQICSSIKKFRLEYIKVINDENGERTGQAFVMFVSNDDARQALRSAKEKGFIADPCKEFDYAHAVDSFIPSALRRRKCEGFYAVKVLGFPSKWDRRDIKKFFQGVEFSSRERIVISEPDSRHSQICAFLILSSQIDVEKALFYDGEEIGKSKLAVSPATKEDVERENSVRRDKKGRNAPKKAEESSREHVRKPREFDELPATIVCLRMTGLPHNCTEKDIKEFFGRVAIAPKDGIQFIIDNSDHFTGEAFIKFVDNSECKKAFAKNRETLGNKVIDLKPLSLWEYQNAFSLNSSHKDNQQKKPITPDLMEATSGESVHESYRMSDGTHDHEISTSRLAAPPINKLPGNSDMPRELIPGLSNWVTANREFQQAQIPPPEIFTDVMPPDRISSSAELEAMDRSKWSAEEYYGYYPERCARDDRYNMHSANYMDPHDMDSHRYRGYGNNGRSGGQGACSENALELQGPLKRPLLPDPILSSPQDMPQMSPNNFHKRHCPTSHSMSYKQRHQNLPPIPPELEHLKGQILLLSNVAYRSTKEDICGWLAEFHPLDDTLKIRHDDNGKPTGHAIVAMETYDDAQRACAMMSGSRFLNRTVHINLM